MTDAQAFIGNATVNKVFRDGTIRILIDVEPAYRERVESTLGLQSDVPVAIAIINPAAAVAIAQNTTIEQVAPYGQHAKALKVSGFFRWEKVWPRVGTDAQFLKWLKGQECAAAKFKADPCKGDIVSAHVRRVGAGAGTSIKPQYSAIPLCDKHHQLQHQHGESYLGSPEWWNAKVIASLELWCWETLKAQLGFEHWNQVPPTALADWAVRNHLERALPGEYKDCA